MIWGFDVPLEQHDIGRALAGGDFVLAFQPVIELPGLQPVAAEALLRWPVAGVALTPTSFWHLVDTPTARAVGAFVSREACEQLAAWRAGGLCEQMSFNVDPRELTADFALGLGAQLERCGLPAGALTVELTETARLADNTAAAAVAALRRLGVGVALDDVGTGFNALAVMRDHALTELKIDRSFVSRIGEPKTDAVIRALVYLARSLDMRTVAEGVETRAQLRKLTLWGVDRAQGHLFSPALSPRQFEGYWRAAMNRSHARGGPSRLARRLIGAHAPEAALARG